MLYHTIPYHTILYCAALDVDVLVEPRLEPHQVHRRAGGKICFLKSGLGDRNVGGHGGGIVPADV